MRTIDSEQLAAVIGGKSTTTQPDGTVTYKQSNYESCVDAVQGSANDRFPDNRWFFQKWFHAKDDNAAPRAEYLAKTLADACGLPPKD
jgi:hypothetical protein